MSEAATVTQEPGSGGRRRSRRLLSDARGRLKKYALKLLGFIVVAVLILKLLPGLEQAWSALQGVSFWWIVGAMTIETVSEFGYVISWTAIVPHLLRTEASL